MLLNSQQMFSLQSLCCEETRWTSQPAAAACRPFVPSPPLSSPFCLFVRLSHANDVIRNFFFHCVNWSDPSSSPFGRWLLLKWNSAARSSASLSHWLLDTIAAMAVSDNPARCNHCWKALCGLHMQENYYTRFTSLEVCHYSRCWIKKVRDWMYVIKKNKDRCSSSPQMSQKQQVFELESIWPQTSQKHLSIFPPCCETKGVDAFSISFRVCKQSFKENSLIRISHDDLGNVGVISAMIFSSVSFYSFFFLFPPFPASHAHLSSNEPKHRLVA